MDRPHSALKEFHKAKYAVFLQMYEDQLRYRKHHEQDSLKHVISSRVFPSTSIAASTKICRTLSLQADIT